MTRHSVSLVAIMVACGGAQAKDEVTVCHFKGQPAFKLLVSEDSEIDHVIIGQKKYEARHAGGSTGAPGRAWRAKIGGKEVFYFINGNESRIIRDGRKDIPGTCR